MSPPNPIQRPEPKRILIVRLSAIGDVIHALPLACALRQRFPRAFLAWVVEQRAAALLNGHEALDELIALPRGFLKSPRGVWQLRHRLRGMEFDTTIDVQGLTKSAILGRLSGARRRIGFGPPDGRELSRWLNSELVAADADHVIDRNLQLLRPLGIESPTVRFQVPEHPPQRAAAERILGELGLSPGGFAIVNVGAGWPSKLWPVDRYAAVAAHLGHVHGLQTLVVWAGAEEHALAERVTALSDAQARTAPRTSLEELAALARRARVCVGSDTGPLHLAVAVGTPCVGLYGPWPAKRNGPYGPANVALQERFFEGSTRQRRTASPELMEAIRTEQVCAACDRILRR